MKSISLVSRPVEYGLRFIGIWPNVTYHGLVQLVWIFMLGTGQVFQYRYILGHFKYTELADLVDCFSTTLPYSLLSIKLIIFWRNRGLLNDILAEMYQDWRDSLTDDQSINYMIKNATISSRCSKLIIGVYATAVCVYTITATDFIGSSSDAIPTAKSRNLLIKMAFPFSIETLFIYECVIVMQFFQLLFVGSAISILDCLMVTLIFHISSQIDIVRGILEGISSPGGEKYTLSQATLRTLVCKHCRIIKLSSRVNQLFTHIALLQFLSNTLIICCIGFVIITSLDNDDGLMMVIKSIFFYIAITLEAFIFCFSGEYLRTESKKICDAAYRSLWYTLTPRDSRAVLLIMLGAQKTLTITAGRFMDLTLEGFAGLLKASASYVSVLTAMA